MLVLQPLQLMNFSGAHFSLLSSPDLNRGCVKKEKKEKTHTIISFFNCLANYSI
jgi:hypothetical protein